VAYQWLSNHLAMTLVAYRVCNTDVVQREVCRQALLRNRPWSLSRLRLKEEGLAGSYSSPVADELLPNHPTMTPVTSGRSVLWIEPKASSRGNV
jgi:hypothetical protein